MTDIYTHQYSTKTCPACGIALTQPNTVRFETSDGDTTTGVYGTCLDNDGFIVDVDDMIAQGLHSGTRCKCGQPLDGYEV